MSIKLSSFGKLLLLLALLSCMAHAQYAPPNTAATSAFTQSGTGAVATTVDAKLKQGWTSAKDFGATGDGTTDDTAAINLAIARINSVGGTLFFPRGTYKVTATLTRLLGPLSSATSAYGNFSLRGDGQDSVLKFTGTGAMFTFAANGSYDNTHPIGAVEVRDLCFWGPSASLIAGGPNSTGSYDASTVGIECAQQSSGGYTFANCTFQGFGIAAIRTADVTGIYIYKCFFRYNKNGLALSYKPDNFIVDAQFTNNDIGAEDGYYHPTLLVGGSANFQSWRVICTGNRIGLLIGGSSNGIKVSGYFENNSKSAVEIGHDSGEFSGSSLESEVSDIEIANTHWGTSPSGLSVKVYIVTRQLVLGLNNASPGSTALVKLVNASADGSTIRNPHGYGVTDSSAATTYPGRIQGNGTLNLATGSGIATSGAYVATLTLAGTTALTLPTTGTLATTANTLGNFGATTSAQLASVISNETGTGVLVFGTSPDFTTGITIGGVAVPTISSSSTLTNKTLSGNTAVTLISGSGTLTLNTTGTATVPNATDTLVGKATTDTLTNKTLTDPVIGRILNGSTDFAMNQNSTATWRSTASGAVAGSLFTASGCTAIGSENNTPTGNGWLESVRASTGSKALGYFQTSVTSGGYSTFIINNDYTSTADNTLGLRNKGTGNLINGDNNSATGVFRVSNGGWVTIGGGTAIKKVLSATATLDFGSTAAGASSDLTITVTGAALNDVVGIGVPNGSTLSNTSYSAWVSATDTVTVRFVNNQLVSAADPASGTFRAQVNQF